jgi:diguanylate cyclase (GGDEF)-like protein
MNPERPAAPLSATFAWLVWRMGGVLLLAGLLEPAPARAQTMALAPASAAAATVPAGLPSNGPKPWPPVLGETLEASLDDPELLLTQTRKRLAELKAPSSPAQAEEAFWLALNAARLQIVLEADTEATASLRLARQLFAAQPRAAPQMQAWLEFMELRHRAITEGSTGALQALLAGRSRHRVDAQSVLGCEWDETEIWLLGEMGSLDEAWRATEALERCGGATGWPHFRAQALSDRAHLAGQAGTMGDAASAGGSPLADERVAQLFEEAFGTVGPGQARFQRSLIAYSAGTTLTEMGRSAEAARQLLRALAASRALGDRAGIAAALTALAALDVREGRHADALRALDEAEPVLRQIGSGTAGRLMALYTRRLQSLVALERRGEMQAAVAGAVALPENGVQPAVRERLARAVAAALAAQGRHATAYEWMQRAHALAEQSRSVAGGAQVLRLQTLYDGSRREAELAALRHAEETTRLSLQAQKATARTLWVALVASAALVAGVAAVGWRQWSRRREMAELALRDTLTGLANRRAIEAYARAQFEQAQRLKLPFTVALVDLDHFKQVNDQHGHATGDAVLRAFASAGPALLRAPDRLGRWGGEEFLLVLPGTAQHELPGVFLRLRAAFAAATVPGLPVPHGRSFSMGGAEAGVDGARIEALVEAADRRLYGAKAAGRDRLG